MTSGWPFVLMVAAAAIVSAAAIVALLPMLRRHALAQPNARSSHQVPTPQGGGIAVMAAAIGVSIIATALLPAAQIAVLWPVLGAAVLLTAVGLVDDLWAVNVLPRLLLQALAVTVAMAALPSELRIAPPVPLWIERATLAVACLWFVNLTNFMDGLDWMTVAEFVPVTLALAILGFLGALPLEATVVALALCGGLIGFAPFNRPVARLFLGDVGSLPIGLVVGWLLALLAVRGHVAAALILPLYYVADATLTLFRRIAKGEPVWIAHRTHFYQRATDHGLRVPVIVGRVFALNLALAALALLTELWPRIATPVRGIVIAVGLVALLLTSFVRGKQ